LLIDDPVVFTAKQSRGDPKGPPGEAPLPALLPLVS
jgi:hypothetical protein